MKKVNDWWAIPAIIICIFVNAYGLSLVSAPILNLETRALSESKISQVIVAKHLKIQESVYREKWIKKNGLASTKSAQYQKWLSHNLKAKENTLKKEVSLATFERIKKNPFYEEFNVV